MAKKKKMTEYGRYQDNIKRYEKKLGRELKWHDYETDNKTGKKRKTEYDNYLESEKKKKKKKIRSFKPKKPVTGMLEAQGY